MSRKIKIEEKKPTGIKNEILQVAEIVARDKDIDKEDAIEAMEDAVLKTAQTKYGDEKNLEVRIDRKTGEIEIFRITNPGDPEQGLEPTREKLPPIEFDRVAAQSARQIINQRIKIAERKKQYEEFSERVGDIITGAVKRVEFQDIILDIGRTEGVIKRSDMIPNETVKIGERIKFLLVGLNEDQNTPLLRLSRTHPDFVKKLFEQEVPEIYDGVVKIVSVVRDPGSKAKMAVFSTDPKLDPIGTCVGLKGARVQAVVNELKGEKIDIILWSENPALYIVNSLSPAKVLRIVMEETGNGVDAVVPNDQLSTAIGRRGQNVRLASRLTGWNISVLTEEEDAANRAKETARLLKLFIENLDVDEMVAHLLIGEGFSSIRDLAETEVSELARIEGFDEDIAKEINQRANAFLDAKKSEIQKLCKEKGVESDIMEYELISPELLEVLINADIKSLDDLGSLATDELLEIAPDYLNQREAETLIMSVRKSWFNDEASERDEN